MNWINLDIQYPRYYEVVEVELTSGEKTQAFLCSDGEDYFFRDNQTRNIYLDSEVVKWKQNELKPKEYEN